MGWDGVRQWRRNPRIPSYREFGQVHAKHLHWEPAKLVLRDIEFFQRCEMHDLWRDSRECIGSCTQICISILRLKDQVERRT